MAPMIAATAHSGWQRLTPLLEAAGLSEPARAEAAHEEVEARLREADTPAALLFCTRPESLLIEAMEQDGDPAARLDAWLDSARTLLQAYRRNRRSAVIVDVDEALAAPDAFLDACARRFSLAVPETTPAPAQAEGEASTPDPVHALIAAQWAAASSDVAPLLEELEASRTPLAASSIQPATDSATAWQTYRELCGRAADESCVQDLQEENELLLLQLHQVQEELETYYLEAQDKEKKYQDLARAKSQLNERHNEVKKEKDELRKENRHLAKRRHELKKDIEKLEKEVARLARERDRARQQVQELKNSRSWKVTSPLRAVRGNSGTRPKAGA